MEKTLPHLYFKVHGQQLILMSIVPYYNVILKRSGIGPHSRDRSEGDAMLKGKGHNDIGCNIGQPPLRSRSLLDTGGAQD